MHTSDVQLTPLFQTVPRRRRGEVAQAADRVTVSAGSVLIRQGELAHEFFVIVDGYASVICDGGPSGCSGRATSSARSGLSASRIGRRP